MLCAVYVTVCLILLILAFLPGIHCSICESRVYSILRSTVHQTELDLAKVRHHIPNHQKPVILHVNLDIVAEVCTFCK